MVLPLLRASQQNTQYSHKPYFQYSIFSIKGEQTASRKQNKPSAQVKFNSVFLLCSAFVPPTMASDSQTQPFLTKSLIGQRHVTMTSSGPGGGNVRQTNHRWNYFSFQRVNILDDLNIVIEVLEKNKIQ